MDNNKIKGFLISEATTIPETPVVISEAEGKHRTIIKTNLQDADVSNRNKRMYPKSVLEHGLESEYVRERLATKTWYGEAGNDGLLKIFLIAG